ncbi:hypothetical protein [Candidatus Methanoprimaticola sp. MG2]|uniref:hypothetical protein n=1 Tax=Candidatus Methanoprimaticola sp. MG2 TaxID=3228838 RepID=UPI0039C6C4D2
MAEKRSGRKSVLKGRTPEQKRKAQAEKDEKKQRRNTRKQISLDRSAARMRRYDAKTEARRKAGGAGMSIVFYEVMMPDGSITKVRKKDGGKRSGKRRGA